jgi:hypothetical protein
VVDIATVHTETSILAAFRGLKQSGYVIAMKARSPFGIAFSRQ